MTSPVRVHLVNLAAADYPVRTAPLALATLGGYLKRNFDAQVEVGYSDMQLASSLGATVDKMRQNVPNVIGISAQFGTAQSLWDVLSMLTSEQAFDETTLIVGNVLATYAYEELLLKYPQVICCLGRGEIPLLELVEHIYRDGRLDSRTHLTGCAYVENGIVKETPGIPTSMATIKSADWNGIFRQWPPESYDEVWIEASRGCSHQRGVSGCTYCAILPSAGSREWEPRESSSVADELTELSAWGVRHVRFADEEFAADHPERCLELAHTLLGVSRGLLADKVRLPTFDLAMRVDDVIRRPPGTDTDLKHAPLVDLMRFRRNSIRSMSLSRLKEAGLRQIYLGVESGSRAQLKRFRKGVRPDDNALALRLLRHLDIQAACGWIMLDPLMESALEIRENVDFIKENKLIPTDPADSFVTSPINKMRALDGSPVVEILREHSLLGPRLATLVEFSFSYLNPTISMISDELDAWTSAYSAAAMYEIKNQVARLGLGYGEDDQLSASVSRLFFKFKAADFSFIDNLSEASVDASDEVKHVRRRHEEERLPLLVELEYYREELCKAGGAV